MSHSKKQQVFKSPDVSKMQEVIIDERTKIYIEKGADPEAAKKRYYERMGISGKRH